MLVASLCSLPVGVLRWRGPTPRLTVIVKATYTIAHDGHAELASEQRPLSLDTSDPHGSPRALWYPSDFVPRKARADVTLVGGAFANPESALIPVQLVVDGLERRFVAHAGAPSPYIPLSETYLHASLARSASTVTVGPRSLTARSLGDAATSLDGWGLPAAPLGEGFDYAAFNAAPPEQQIRGLYTDASITLVGAVRGGDRRTVVLPGHHPRAFHAGAGGPGATPNEIVLTADTLWIDSYSEVCVMVWRGEIALAARPERPEEILVTLEQGPARRTWTELRAAFARARRNRAIEPVDLGAVPRDEDDDPRSARLDLEDEIADHKLLDAHEEDGDDEPTNDRPRPPEVHDEPTAEPEVVATPAAEATGVVDLALLQRQRALPFGAARPHTLLLEEHNGSVELAQLRASSTLPFARKRGTLVMTHRDEDRPPQDLSATPFARTGRRPNTLVLSGDLEELRRALAPATPFERHAPPLPRDDAPPRSVRTDALPFSQPPAAIVLSPEAAPHFAPEPHFAPLPVSPDLAPIEATPTSAPIASRETPLLELEMYAAIKAELWRRSPLALPVVAAEHGLTEVEWLTHDLRYIEAIDAQAKEGTSVIAASVARAMAAAKRARDAESDLDLTGYLALKSEIEAGDAAGALKKRGLTRRALRRIERRWQPKTAR